MTRQPVTDALDLWVDAGLINDDEREAIVRFERTRAEPKPGTSRRPGRIPAVSEALGYLGGMLALIGLGLIVGHYWPDMGTAGRLALSGATALVLLGGGAVTREATDPALARLRGFLWLAATAAVAVLARVAMVDGLDEAPETVVLVCAASVAILSGLLWAGRDRPLQQLTFLGGVVVWAGAVGAEVESGAAVGLIVWAVGAMILLLGLRRIIAAPLLTEGVGAAAALVGSVMTAADSGPGMLFMTATAFGLVVIATVPGSAIERPDRLLLGVLGGLALVQATPPTLGWFSRDAGGATGLTTWVIGALLLYVGSRGHTLLPVPTEVLGGAALLAGAALTGTQWHGAAPLIGIATALILIVLGTVPGQVLLSIFGSVGLLINVPWAVGWFFPGEDRAPLLILVSGAVIIGVAVILSRTGGRFRNDLRSMRRRGPHGFLPGPPR